MHNPLHPVTQAALRELLLGVGFGALALATHAPESSAFDGLVVAGFVLVAGATVVGITDEQTQPLLGGA